MTSTSDLPGSWSAEHLPSVTLGLLRGILDICLDAHITHLSAVMEPALIGLLRSRFSTDQRVDRVSRFAPDLMAYLHDLIEQVRRERHPLGIVPTKRCQSVRTAFLDDVRQTSDG